MQDKHKKLPFQKHTGCQKKVQKQAKDNFLKLLKPEELKKLDFNKAEYEYFIENCNFTDRQKEILDMRRKGFSIIMISLKIPASERTIYRELKQIKKKIYKVL